MPTGISYVDETWNPVCGCTKCSPGCENCYAERMAVRQWHMWKYEGGCCYDKTISLDSLREKWGWSGEVVCRNDQLNKPLHWRNPRRILVPSMGDLFHPDVPEGFIIDVFDVIAQASAMGHTILVLTKRIKRMAEIVGDYCEGVAKMNGVYLGVTICTQKEADEKIPLLLQIPAAHRWLSIEPLLGEIVNPHLILGQECLECGGTSWNKLNSQNWCNDCGLEMPPKIDWVVVGCESGPKKRPCKLDWIRSIVEQGKAAGVGVHVKQIPINGKVEHDIEKFPKDLQIREVL